MVSFFAVALSFTHFFLNPPQSHVKWQRQSKSSVLYTMSEELRKKPKNFAMKKQTFTTSSFSKAKQSSASCQSSFYCTQLYDHLLAKYLGFYGKVVVSGKSFILGRGHPFIDTLLTLILQSCLPARKELWLLFSTPHWRMGWVTNSHWLKPARCL